MGAGARGSSHIEFIVIEQREMDAGTQLVSPPGPQPIE